MQCPSCHSTNIQANDSTGESVCTNCGVVCEENTIVSTIEFQEIGERSAVIGQYVSATSTKPIRQSYGGVPKIGFARESREQTLSKAKKAITQVAGLLDSFLPAMRHSPYYYFFIGYSRYFAIA